MAIEMNTGKTQNMPISQTSYESLSKMSGENAAAMKEVTSKAMEVLAGANLKVTKSDTAGVDGAAEKKTNGATSTPVLDNPDDAKAKEVDLTKLISYIQLDNQERQTEMAKDRIEMNKSGLDAEHESRMEQIDDSIKKMKDAERASKISRIFGWIGAVLAVAAAAVLTVVTGGLAAGFAIAGAALAVTSLTLNETGAMDKITQALTDHLKETYGMSSNDAKLAASLIINLSIMAAQIGCSIGGMVAGFAAAASAAANATATGMKVAADAGKTTLLASETARNIQNILTVVNTAVGAGSLASNGVSTFMSYRSQSAQADTTELEKFMTMLRQRLEESQEELQQILQQIQSGVGMIAEMISSATDTSTEIAQNIGAMA